MSSSSSRRNILPFYLVCDQSYSMSGKPIQALNDALDEIHEAIGSHPVIADKARLCVIGFSDEAEVLLPLSQLNHLDRMPTLDVIGGTSFVAAFGLVKEQIERDVQRLKDDNAQVFRPCVFFLTDGVPTDPDPEWRAALKELAEMPGGRAPNLLAFGIGEGADEEVIATVGRTRGFKSNPTIPPAVALKEFAVALTRSMIQSARVANPDYDPYFVVSEGNSGFTSLDTRGY